MSSYLKWSLKIIAGIIISVIIVLLTLYIAIHTQSFNNWALEFTLEKLNSSLKDTSNRITAESMEGNILTGLQLNNGAVVIHGDTTVKFQNLKINYELLPLLDNKISIEQLELNSPQVYLNKIKDENDSLVWNFTQLFPESEDTDTSSSPFDWDIDVENFKINNGLFSIKGKEPSDSTDENIFDPELIDIKDFNLDLAADYFRDKKHLELKNLSFNTNSDFSLRKFSLIADIDGNDTTTAINNLKLLTSRSEVYINKIYASSINPLDGFDIEKFGKRDLDADIDIKNFNFDDLKYFVPSLTMLDSSVSLKLIAKGKYDDLNVNELKAELPNSSFEITGNIKNLSDPANLYSDVAMNNIRLDPNGVNKVYNDRIIRQYAGVGLITGNLNYKGTFEDFSSAFDLNTGAGSITGDAMLNLQNEEYTANVTSRSLNLARILNDNSLKSNINAQAFVKGKGFDPGRMNAEMNYSLNGSSFGGYNIRRSAGTVKASGSNYNLNVMASTSSGDATVKGTVNLSNTKNPVYNVSGKVSRLNVAGFTKNPEDQSNLNFSYNIKGHGSDLRNINGKYNFNFSNSVYAGRNIPEGPVDIELRNSGNGSYADLKTDFLTFNAEGKFNVNSLGKVITSNINSLTNDIGSLTKDSSFIPADQTFYFDEIDFTYKLAVMDSLRTAALLQPFGLNFNGNVSGRIKNDQSGFNTSMLLDASHFSYNDTAIVLKNVKSDLDFTNKYSPSDEGHPFNNYALKIGLTGDKIFLDSTYIDSVKLDLDLADREGKIDLKAKQDSSYVVLDGKLFANDNDLTAVIDTFKASYGGYTAANDSVWKIVYVPKDKISFEQFSVESRKISVSIIGDYSFNEASDITLKSDSIKPADLVDFLSSLDSNTFKPGPKRAEGNISLNVHFKGTTDDPELNVKLISNDLKYNDSLAGNFDALINYKNSLANADIMLSNPGGEGGLKITGEVPYANPFDEDTTSTARSFSQNSVKLTLTSDNLELGSFTALVPNMPELHGTLNGEITLGGIVSMPELKGNLKIDDGLIFMKLTGMYYKYLLNASTEDSKLTINPLSIYNVNDNKRHFDITGNIDFKDLLINDIDLRTSGDVVFLDGDALRNDFGVEGYLLAGVGNDPVIIKGNLEKLDITGQLLVKEATISSIPSSGSGYNPGDDNFIYIDDTRDTAWKDTVIYVTEEMYRNIDPFEKDLYVSEDSVSTGSDFLNLDIKVKTEKTVYVSIDFKNITRDRLFGEIKADLDLKTENGELNAYGTVNVEDDSYYRFYRNFKLNDSKLTFNGPIADPDLDIQAVYEGTKTNDQLGTNSSYTVKVMLSIKGKIDKPDIALNLFENDSEIGGSDAQTDAITYLLFGRYKSELSANERKGMASSVGAQFGSLYVTSFLSKAVREILPFIVDAEFNYNQDNNNETESNMMITSELGDATVKVGSELFKSGNNIEFSVDYPVNKLLNLDLPESIIIRVSREQISNNAIDNSQEYYTTGVRIAYKLKY